MTLSQSQGSVLKAAAVYDLAVTSILIIPPVVPFLLGVIAHVDHSLGFGTVFSLPDRTTIFFFNLAAAAVTAWAVIRLLQPSRLALIVDVFFRLALVACQVWAVLGGATPILLGISAVLVVLAVLEWLVWRQPGHPLKAVEA